MSRSLRCGVQLPNVDVQFLSTTGSIMVGQPGMLPLQVVNIGKRSSVLGNMKITTEAGMIEERYQPDRDRWMRVVPHPRFHVIRQSNPDSNSEYHHRYTDDFNQPRVLTRKLEVEVPEGMSEEPIFDPSIEGGGGEMQI